MSEWRLVDLAVLLLVVVLTGGAAGLVVLLWIAVRTEALRYRKTLTPGPKRVENDHWWIGWWMP